MPRSPASLLLVLAMCVPAIAPAVGQPQPGPGSPAPKPTPPFPRQTPTPTPPQDTTSPKDPATTPAPATPPVPPSTTPPPGMPDGAADLRPKWVIGQSRRLRLSMTSSTTTTIPGLSDPLAEPADKPSNTPAQGDDESSRSLVDQTYVLRFSPKSVGESGAVVEVTFESIRLTLDAAGMRETFDSDLPPPKPSSPSPLQPAGELPLLERTLRPLVGDTLTLHLDADGTITRVEGGDKFSALFATASAAGSASSPAPASLFSGLLTLRKGQAFAKPGDRWTTESQASLAPTGAVRLRTETTLTSFKPPLATLTFEGGLLPGSADPAGKIFHIDKATHRGTCEWDSAAGFLRSMSVSQTLETSLELGGIKGRAVSEQTTKADLIR